MQLDVRAGGRRRGQTDVVGPLEVLTEIGAVGLEAPAAVVASQERGVLPSVMPTGVGYVSPSCWRTLIGSWIIAAGAGSFVLA